MTADRRADDGLDRDDPASSPYTIEQGGRECQFLARLEFDFVLQMPQLVFHEPSFQTIGNNPFIVRATPTQVTCLFQTRDISKPTRSRE